MREIDGDAEALVTIRLNGGTVTGRAVPRMQLADFIRHVLGARGTHVGCEHGICGACTVLVDDRAVRSCLLFAVQAEGCDVRTIEGLARGDELGPIQQAFSRRNALQCGFCTPGILMSTVQFLRENPEPVEREVRTMLSGHLCRCTGYQAIVEAIMDVAAQRNAS